MKTSRGLRSYIHSQGVMPYLLSSASLLKRPCVLYCNLDVTLAKGSCHSVVEDSVMGEGAPSRLCARDGMKAGSLPRQPLPWHVPPTGSIASCDPRLLPRVSLHREPSILSSLQTPKHSTNAMAPFSRAPLNLTIALFDLSLSAFRWSSRSLAPRCA